MPQVPWVQEQLLTHLGGKSKALRSLFPSLGVIWVLSVIWSTLGVIWDKVGCRGDGVRKGGVGGYRTPGLSLIPVPLPALGQCGWRATGGFATFMAGRGNPELLHVQKLLVSGQRF